MRQLFTTIASVIGANLESRANVLRVNGLSMLSMASPDGCQGRFRQDAAWACAGAKYPAGSGWVPVLGYLSVSPSWGGHRSASWSSHRHRS